MTPEWFEKEVDSAIQKMVARGFRLVKGSFGTIECGCALTALFVAATPEENRDEIEDEFIPEDVIEHVSRVGLHCEESDAFIDGFDDFTVPLYASERAVEFARAGIRIRLKGQNLMDDSPEG